MKQDQRDARDAKFFAYAEGEFDERYRAGRRDMLRDVNEALDAAWAGVQSSRGPIGAIRALRAVLDALEKREAARDRT